MGERMQCLQRYCAKDNTSTMIPPWQKARPWPCGPHTDESAKVQPTIQEENLGVRIKGVPGRRRGSSRVMASEK